MHQPLHAGMGAAVLAHLSQFASLEGLLAKHGAKDGFIAGQAVASAVSELFYSGFAVAYNDVDAFLFSTGTSPIAVRPRRVLALLECEELVRTESYGHMVASTSSVYTVVETRRDGMLNEVLCNCHYRDYLLDSAALARAFLQSFDMNCVQVGVRLSDRQLVWTPAFEVFLANQELLVMNVKTPIHTAVRWFRKKAELAGVYGHDDKTMELLASATARVRQCQDKYGSQSMFVIMKAREAQLAFGKEYAAKAASVANELTRYFDIAPVTGKRIALNTLVPRGCERPELVSAQCDDLVLPTYARALQGHWRRHVCEQVKQALALPANTLRHISVAVDGIETVADPARLRDLARLDKLLEAHPGLQHLMVPMNTSRQVAFADAVGAIVAREGLWAYGVFEQLGDVGVELSTIELAQLPSYLETLFAERVAYFEEQSRLAVRRHAAWPALEWQDFHVRELVTFRELLEEGVRMHHCVGGYFGGVLSERCRIMRLQRPRVQDSLTLELQRRGRGWKVAQLRGLQNRPAGFEEMGMATSLTTHLNVQHALASCGLALSLAQVHSLVRRLPKLAEAFERLLLGNWKYAWERRKWAWRVKWGQLTGGRFGVRKPAWAMASFKDRLAKVPAAAGGPAMEEFSDEIPF